MLDLSYTPADSIGTVQQDRAKTDGEGALQAGFEVADSGIPMLANRRRRRNLLNATETRVAHARTHASEAGSFQTPTLGFILARDRLQATMKCVSLSHPLSRSVLAVVPVDA
jgi:hypothetical protein